MQKSLIIYSTVDGQTKAICKENKQKEKLDKEKNKDQ